MPARATRLRDLHDHAVRSRGARPPELHLALRLYPSWRRCEACGWPIDPAAGGSHPGCAPDLEQRHVRVCGRGFTEVIVASHCRRCGWTGPVWDGPAQPPLDDAAHVCTPRCH